MPSDLGHFMTIDFGDGTVVEADISEGYSYTYQTSGNYCVKIYNWGSSFGIVSNEVKYVKIGKNITTIEWLHAGKAESIEIPTSVNNIMGFGDILTLNTIVMKGTTPPTLGSNGFSNCPNLQKIIVPYEALETYKNAAGWSDYATIIDAYVLVSTMENRLSDILVAAKSYTDENTPVIERLG